jgi:hypothetical protein
MSSHGRIGYLGRFRWALAVTVSMLLVAGVPSVGASESAVGAGLVVESAAPVGAEFPVTGRQARPGNWDPQITHNPVADEYLVVWTDGRRDRAGVYGQRVSANGERLDSNFRISRPDSVFETYETPIVAWNSVRDEFLVLWYEGRGSGYVGQRVSADGERLGERVVVSGAAGPTLWAVTFNPVSGQYLVVMSEWDLVSDPSRSQLRGLLLDRDGHMVGSDFRISGGKATVVRDPAVTVNTSRNEYLVVWEDDRNDTTRGDDIFGQRLAVDGSRIGWNFRVSGGKATDNEGNPSLAYSSAQDRFLVVWTDSRDRESRGDDVFGQVLTGAGDKLGWNVRISRAGSAYFNDSGVGVAYNSVDDNYLVSWTDGRRVRSAGVGDVFAQQLSVDGERIGRNFRVTTWKASIAAVYGCDVAHSPVGNEYLIVWRDDRREPEDDVYARRIAP